MDQWSPIETAPKDGTMLILADDGCVFMGFWNARSETWDDGDFFDNMTATHWMCAPSPPSPDRAA